MTEFIELCKNVATTDEFHMFIKLILISILSGVIGFERESYSKPAGFRTHVLVGISAVLVMVCGMEISQMYGTNDPTRIPAQLLSGIGFIGAGTILSNGFKVRGLTTASGLLAVTCIGLAVGAGLYVYSIIATVVVYIVLKYSHILNPKVEHITSMKFKITVSNPKEVLSYISEIIAKYEMDVKKVKVVDNDDEDSHVGYIIYDCKANREINKNEFITQIAKLEKVKQINEI